VLTDIDAVGRAVKDGGEAACLSWGCDDAMAFDLWRKRSGRWSRDRAFGCLAIR
jgi:hypothetical protein